MPVALASAQAIGSDNFSFKQLAILGQRRAACASGGTTVRGRRPGRIHRLPSRAFRFGEGSFAVPYNTRMEPSRSTVLCDHVAEARGSFAALYGRMPGLTTTQGPQQ